MVRTLIILFLVLLVLPGAVLAQSAPTVTVDVLDECYVGDTIPLRIRIQNSVNATPPDLGPLLDRDFGVTFVNAQPSTSRFMISVNGRTREEVNQSLELTYALTPRRAGEFTIPAIKVEIDGRTLTTQPVLLKVSEPSQAQGLGSSVELTRAYVGQAFKLTLSWVLTSAAEDPVFNLNLPEGAFAVFALPPAAPPGAQARQFADVEFIERASSARAPVRGALAPASIDGETRTKFTAEFLLVPKKPGTFECGGARVDFHAVIGKREPSVFDPLGSRSSITQRRFAVAPPKTINVLELPVAGRPADFSGLVGQFELDAECQPRQASVGDPLNYTLVLRSKLPIFDPPTIDLSRQSGGEGSLASGFRVPLDPVLPQLARDTAIYSAQIRPRSTKITEVPPVELSYFDPVEEKYRTAKSNRLPLKVSPSAAVSLGSLEGLAEEEEQAIRADDPDAARPTRSGEPSIERVEGLFPPIGPAIAAQSSPEPVRLERLAAAAAGLVAVPTVLWCIGSVLAGRTRAAKCDPAAWRRRGALRRAERELGRNRANDASQASAAMRGFIADWFDLPEDAVTTGDAVAAVRSLDPVLAARTRAILESCDRQLFGSEGDSGSAVHPESEAITIIREIARAPRGPIVTSVVQPAQAGGAA